MTPGLNGNWIDLIIVLLLILFASEAWRYGFLGILVDFASFLFSLLISFRLYKFTAIFIKNNFNLTSNISNALGFIVTAIILEAVFGYLFTFLVSLLPKDVRKSKINKILGLIPALGEGVILVAFLLTAVVALPVRPDIKKAVSESRLGGFIIKETSGIEKVVNQVFGGAINDALTYFTVEPGSKSTIQLGNGIDHLSYDHEAEAQMLSDVNRERVSRGLAALTLSPKIVGVAEAYAWDTWTRHYFSHYSPEGKTVADRFNAAGIPYTVAGENLALAPTEQTAMTGLMNSPGHKANILDPDFHKVGIGVVDNGIYGMIFVQEFSN